jgi:hypothetical protein
MGWVVKYKRIVQYMYMYIRAVLGIHKMTLGPDIYISSSFAFALAQFKYPSRGEKEGE